jgi:hypothetical protein
MNVEKYRKFFESSREEICIIRNLPIEKDKFFEYVLKNTIDFISKKRRVILEQYKRGFMIRDEFHFIDKMDKLLNKPTEFIPHVIYFDQYNLKMFKSHVCEIDMLLENSCIRTCKEVGRIPYVIEIGPNIQDITLFIFEEMHLNEIEDNEFRKYFQGHWRDGKRGLE